MPAKKIIANSENFESFVSQNHLILFYFFSKTCGQCKMIAPIIDQVADANVGVAEILKADIEENPYLVEKFTIRSLPSIVVIKDGKEISKNIGAMPKSVIQKLINQALED